MHPLDLHWSLACFEWIWRDWHISMCLMFPRSCSWLVKRQQSWWFWCYLQANPEAALLVWNHDKECGESYHRPKLRWRFPRHSEKDWSSWPTSFHHQLLRSCWPFPNLPDRRDWASRPCTYHSPSHHSLASRYRSWKCYGTASFNCSYWLPWQPCSWSPHPCTVTFSRWNPPVSALDL